MKKLSLLKISASETVTINSLALQKISAGDKVFNLSVGEPVMPVAFQIKKEIPQSLKLGEIRYPPVAGFPELRISASKWMNKSYAGSFKEENTLVVNGGKFGLFLLLQAIIKPGDEVLISSPYWVSYINMVKLFKGKTKIITTTIESEWKIKAKDISKNSNSRTKLLILNNGGNPTGAIYTTSELKDILDVAAQKNLFVISDEVYSGLVYDGWKYVSCAQFKKHQDRVAIIQSCSKNFAMPGLRIGFVFASIEVIKVLTSLMSQSTSGVTTLSQFAALAAFKQANKIMLQIRNEMQKRRDIFVKEFSRQFQAELKPPCSALYAFISLKSLGCANLTSMEFCQMAMEKVGVGLVPGSAFGQEGYVRFSFGEKPSVIKKALKKLSQYVKN